VGLLEFETNVTTLFTRGFTWKEGRMISPRVRVAGMVLGIAAVTFAGIMALSGAHRPAAQPASASLALDPVVAPARALSKAFAAVAKKARPAVVGVYSEKLVTMRQPGFPFSDDFFQQFFGQQGMPFQHPGFGPREERVPQKGMGSGMILDHDGNILTNYHVIADVDRIKVQLADKRSFSAKVVSSDPKSDVAIIRISDHVPDDLPTVSLGNSDALEVGDLVVAIGAPFGLTQTVTHGIISAKGRSDVGITTYEDFLQTDAPINPGNSGGPLLNMDGEVIGMNSAIATGGGGQSAGVGFAIPSNMIKGMLPKLIKGGRISHGSIGVVIQDIDEKLARSFHVKEGQGILVAQVNPDSPAERAGVKRGDIITKAGDTGIDTTNALRTVVASTTPGNELRLDLLRDGKALSVVVKVGAQGSDQERADLGADAGGGGGPNALAHLGAQLHDLTPDLASRFGTRQRQGVVVLEVEPGSIAASAGLRPGDIVLEANRHAVTDMNSLTKALDDWTDGLVLLVRRGNNSFYIAIDASAEK
jgi:serine protease Do